MAEEKKPKSSSSSSGSTNYKTEQPVMVDTTGIDIRELLGHAVGKDFDQMNSKDFEAFAASKGVIRKDVRKMTRAFDSIKKNSARQYLVDTDGFNVIEENLPLSRSGRDIGNKKGLDIGDLVGLGNNVSLLAGFSSRELTSYRKDKEKRAVQEANLTKTVGDPLTEGSDRKAAMPMTAGNLVRKNSSAGTAPTGKKSTGTKSAAPAGNGPGTPPKNPNATPSGGKAATKGTFVGGGGSFKGTGGGGGWGDEDMQPPKKGIQKAVDFMVALNDDVERRNKKSG
jgi:hypothetical protein